MIIVLTVKLYSHTFSSELPLAKAKGWAQVVTQFTVSKENHTAVQYVHSCFHLVPRPEKKFSCE